ncbi:MAG: sporulation initiation factor Spo0A C-terminal domain-containing protein [Firmicutes bacterium]|nr:sporulation initiation factor Spo0A C-terminal domain-containing protein [Bacillota bacterium]
MGDVINFTAEEEEFFEFEVTNIMLEMGMFPNLLGFDFIKEAVFIMLKYNYRRKIGEVYKDIAKNRKTSENSVEKAIRHAVEYSYRIGKLKELEKKFGFKFIESSFCTTNNQFISILFLFLKRRKRIKEKSSFNSII